MVKNNTIIYIGLAASIFSSLAFSHQVFIHYRDRTKSQLTYPTLFVNIIGQILWLTYGIMTKDKIIILAAVVTVSMYFLLLLSTYIFR